MCKSDIFVPDSDNCSGHVESGGGRLKVQAIALITMVATAFFSQLALE
jgi:hypothetical protein